jgi:hypothetical protein
MLAHAQELVYIQEELMPTLRYCTYPYNPGFSQTQLLMATSASVRKLINYGFQNQYGSVKTKSCCEDMKSRNVIYY